MKKQNGVHIYFRYEPDPNTVYPGFTIKTKNGNIVYNNIKDFLNLHNNKYPSEETSHIVNWSTLLFCKIYFIDEFTEIDFFHSIDKNRKYFIFMKYH